MKRLLRLPLALTAAALVAAAVPASANTVTYSTTGLTNMVHQNAYTWYINGISVNPSQITGARLTFFNFFNWTTAAADPTNILWVNLLDTATNSGSNGAIGSMVDNTNGSTLGINDVLDGFRYSGGNNVSVVGASGLVTAATAKTYVGSSTNANDASVLGYNPAGSALGSNSGPFTNNGPTGTTWTLDFASAAVTALAQYITNGQNIALGLDSDCHFGDSSIQLEIFYNPGGGGGGAAVPEPTTMLLVGSGMAMAAYRRRRQQAKQ